MHFPTKFFNRTTFILIFGVIFAQSCDTNKKKTPMKDLKASLLQFLMLIFYPKAIGFYKLFRNLKTKKLELFKPVGRISTEIIRCLHKFKHLH